VNIVNIRETCKQIIAEVTAIVEYTDSIEAVTDDTIKGIFTEVRFDELSHLQKHVIALTAMLNGEEPEAAAQMDSGDAEEKTEGFT